MADIRRKHPQQSDESLEEMAEVTASRPGFVGKLLVTSLIVVSVAVTAFVGYAIFNGIGGVTTGNDLIASDKYQAVFVSNGSNPQVFFGKLANIDGDYAELSEVYFLQVQQAEGEDGETTDRLVLGRLDNSQLYKAEGDQLQIKSDQVLYWENLSDESQVSQAIEQFKTTGGNTVEGTDSSFPPATTDTTNPASGN